jgi:outer membrane protein OmpA-like peptidoglycan-associated protein
MKPQKPGAGLVTNQKRPPTVKAGRKLTAKEREAVAETVRRDDLPTADLEVYFDFNSATIAPSALPMLKTLGQALADGRLAGGTFIVGGHTDAKGADDYNQRLSQRRAQAVRDFLVGNFPIEPKKLMAVGYGEEQLKSVDEPLAAVNRRVQVINWTDMAGK